jgi:hypothetical protein
MRHAIINAENMVVNIVVWEGKEWLPPRNHTVVRTDTGNIGDIYDPVKGIFKSSNNNDE